ncbi:MAG: hypothetical protein O7I42_18515 [Alphaproteobacteria bacterium]|nr:hypothetical protein [Alphaproteobacteria bacterium]
MRPEETPATNIDLLAVEDENLDTINTWFEAPHVLPWWGGPATTARKSPGTARAGTAIAA